jgi:protein-disulfide isomerase
MAIMDDLGHLNQRTARGQRPWLVYGCVVALALAIATTIQIAFPILYKVANDVSRFYSPTRSAQRAVAYYIHSHPHEIAEAVRKADEQELAVSNYHAEIYANASDTSIGDSQAQAAIVEFFDYRCSHCESVARELDRLLASKPHVRIVLRDLPILGEESEYASRMALAVGRHGKYADFYRAMFLRDPWSVDRAVIDKTVVKLGLDPSAIRKESEDPAITEIIQRNRQLAGKLLIQATPSFVIGDKVQEGELSAEELQAAIIGLQQVGKLTIAVRP